MKNFYWLIQGDCLKVLPKLESESVDLAIIDPPYFLLKGRDWDSFDSLESFLKFTEEWLNQVFRVLKIDRQAYVFWSQRYLSKFYELKSNFKIERLLIWYYKNYTKSGYIVKNFIWDYDPIFFLSKGKIEVFNLKHSEDCGQSSVLTFTKPQRNFKTDLKMHPTQKPIKLIERLVKASSNIGDVILDPFLGSGTTMEACQNLGRSCIGIEINPEYCEIVKKRCFGRQFLDREVEYKFTIWDSA